MMHLLGGVEQGLMQKIPFTAIPYNFPLLDCSSRRQACSMLAEHLYK